jgi:DNA-directed RNA polymerase subunit RPC12/RpoP
MSTHTSRCQMQVSSHMLQFQVYVCLPDVTSMHEFMLHTHIDSFVAQIKSYGQHSWGVASTNMSYKCNHCMEHIDGGWRFYQHMDKSAIVCGDCIKWLWRDHCKLEEYTSHHERNQTFPAFVITSVQRKTNSLSMSL